MNKHDLLIAQLAATLAPGLHDHLMMDDNFVEALHTSIGEYVAKQEVFADDVEIDIAMELVQRVAVLQN